MNQILLIALIMILFWVVGFGTYVVISNRQRGLVEDVNRVSQLLEDEGIE